MNMKVKEFYGFAKDILIDCMMNLNNRPNWVDEDVFNFAVKEDYLDIIMFGSYHIGLHFDPNESVADFAKTDGSSAYSKEDLIYAAEIMENRDKILALARKELNFN